MRKNLTCLILSTGLLLAAGSSFAQTPVVVYKPDMSTFSAPPAQIGLETASTLLAGLNYPVRWLNNAHDTLIVECSRNGVTLPIYVTLSADGRDICLRTYLTKLDDALATRAPWDKMVEMQESINPIQFSYVPATGWLSIWYSIDNYGVTKDALNNQLGFYVDNIFASRSLWDPNQWAAGPVSPAAPPAPMPPAPAPQASNAVPTHGGAQVLHQAITDHLGRCKDAAVAISQDIAEYVNGKSIDLAKLRRDQAEFAAKAAALLNEADRFTASDAEGSRLLASYQDYCHWMLPTFTAVFADCTNEIAAAADLAQPGATREAAVRSITASVTKMLADLREHNTALSAAEKHFLDHQGAVAAN